MRSGTKVVIIAEGSLFALAVLDMLTGTGDIAKMAAGAMAGVLAGLKLNGE